MAPTNTILQLSIIIRQRWLQSFLPLLAPGRDVWGVLATSITATTGQVEPGEWGTLAQEDVWTKKRTLEESEVNNFNWHLSQIVIHFLTRHILCRYKLSRTCGPTRLGRGLLEYHRLKVSLTYKFRSVSSTLFYYFRQNWSLLESLKLFWACRGPSPTSNVMSTRVFPSSGYLHPSLRLCLICNKIK